MRTVRIILVIAVQLFYVCIHAMPLTEKAQDDTVLVVEVGVPPVFDGIGNDAGWQTAEWQSIDQVWIPWGTTMNTQDFSARYKVTWSSSANLLYFLLEITDDIVSDAYEPGATAAIYNFDMFEVFIDENKSGGYHVFDGTANNEASLGINAENAFAYHIFTAFPASGSTTETFRVEDLGGTDWAHVENEVYNDHFPDFILRKDGNINTWEFSLLVYDDTYSDDNVEDSRVTLTEGKIIGLSIAYNDDDEPEVDPSMTQRDNFIGSVAVTEAAYNDHWKNANDFGTLKLVSGPSSLGFMRHNNDFPMNVYPNPASSGFTVQLHNEYIGPLELNVYNHQGTELISVCRDKNGSVLHEFLSFAYKPGMYIVELRFGENRYHCPLTFMY